MSHSPAPSAPAGPSLYKRLGASAPVAIVLSFFPPLGGFALLATLTQLGPWLRGHGTEGMVIYFLVTGLLMGVSLLPTYSCAILAGWAFGVAAGLPLAITTITVASIIAYGIGRWIARDRVVQVIRERPRWDAVYRALLDHRAGRALFVVTLLRVPPQSPFALANFVLAAGRVRPVDYIFGTLIGITPRTTLAVTAAAGVEQLQFKTAANPWIVGGGIAVTLIVCVVLGLLANRALRKVTAERPGAV